MIQYIICRLVLNMLIRFKIISLSRQRYNFERKFSFSVHPESL